MRDLSLAEEARAVGEGFDALAADEQREPERGRNKLQREEPALAQQRRVRGDDCAGMRFDAHDVGGGALIGIGDVEPMKSLNLTSMELCQAGNAILKVH